MVLALRFEGLNVSLTHCQSTSNAVGSAANVLITVRLGQADDDATNTKLLDLNLRLARTCGGAFCIDPASHELTFSVPQTLAGASATDIHDALVQICRMVQSYMPPSFQWSRHGR